MFQSFKISNRFILFITLVIFMATVIISLSSKAQAINQGANSILYFPIISLTERSLPPPVGVAASIQLPNAECPNDLSFNQQTKYLYITNEISDNMSLIRNDAFVANLDIGDWPIHVRSDPNSNTTYATAVLGGITILDGGNIVTQIAPYHESYYITINPINGYTYINDLGKPITLLQGSTKIMDLEVPDYNDHEIVWQLVGDYDETTGKTYFASWQYGIMTEVDGTTISDQFEYHGIGAVDIVVDSVNGFIYTANSRPGGDNGPYNNISIVNLETKDVHMGYTGQQSRHVDLDPGTGMAYVTNPKDNSITVMQGHQILGTHPVGEKPWDVTVDQTTGYAYIGNSEDNSISIFRDGVYIKTIQLPAGMGYQPIQITIDQDTHDVYVLNRSSFVEVYDEIGHTRLVCEQPWVHILR